ncbi:helix-turn-helix domain-containing protein [Brachybacterium sp. NPDC056505]|uniref:helix-turn-helix domain-containing protein n=1 Tax=Brachybacterium sp. NPDC056505 TaxID=3345843 RepID=UPI00366FFBAB
MADTVNLLGQYLRARRDLVTPAQAGIPQIGMRRVPGLRREEVAMLAGISSDYYLRLEQGRDHSPSRQVLEALARVLQLDEDGAVYLLSLAGDRPRPTRRRVRREVVPAGVSTLVDTIGFPAFVEGRYFDVLAANPMAAALSPRLTVGANRLRDVFLDPAERDLYPDWDAVTRQLIAGFRESVGTDVENQRFVELVGSLSLASPRFRELWGRHDVTRREGATITLDHPQVGALTLYREKLPITGTAGQMLVLYHPEPGGKDADALTLLSASALPVRDPAHSDR